MKETVDDASRNITGNIECPCPDEGPTITPQQKQEHDEDADCDYRGWSRRVDDCISLAGKM
jgi:hypothetical protein